MEGDGVITLGFCKHASKFDSAKNLELFRYLVRPPTGCHCSKQGCLTIRSQNYIVSDKLISLTSDEKTHNF